MKNNRGSSSLDAGKPLQADERLYSMLPTFRLWTSSLFLLNLLSPIACATTEEQPLIIGHRGASGYRPEHTLASYQLAMDMGADFIEPDLVITKDGIVVARHEPNLIDTTDVLAHPEFAERRTKKWVDSTEMDGFFVEDFSFAELRTLRAVQSRPYRDQSFNGQFLIPSLEEIIALVQSYEQKTGRKVGIYPETKHPSYFRQKGFRLEETLVDTLLKYQFVDPTRIYIQSFEVSNLRDLLKPLLAEKGLNIPLIQLFDEWRLQPADYVLAGRKETYGDLIRSESLQNHVASYARGIGVWKASIVERTPLSAAIDLDGNGKAECTDILSGNVQPTVTDAHAAGLLVHVYTMRDEERFLAKGYTSARDEYLSLRQLGVDGFFTDFPDTARAAFDLP